MTIMCRPLVQLFVSHPTNIIRKINYYYHTWCTFVAMWFAIPIWFRIIGARDNIMCTHGGWQGVVNFCVLPSLVFITYTVKITSKIFILCQKNHRKYTFGNLGIHSVNRYNCIQKPIVRWSSLPSLFVINIQIS